MKSFTAAFSCIALAMSLSPRTAGAIGEPAPGAVTAQTVKLPDGPGSVRGLASDASVNTFTGQVTYEIPIELPGGPGGLAPKLALSYNGALGNGPLGLGWSFGLAGVRRSLRLGVPAYTSIDELELVGFAGATLVPLGNGQFRAEGQGHSLRGVSVDGGFELVDSNGTRYRIGTSEASRVFSGTKVAAWHVERVTDVAGHTIDYTYQRHRGELYLTGITWGGSGVYRAELIYETRPDATTSWRMGFSIGVARRLQQVRLWSFGEVRRTVELGYDSTFALSRLSSVRVVGRDAVTATPATTLVYAAPEAGQVQQVLNLGGWNLRNNTTTFFDIDRDGAMDLLRVESGNQRYRRNLGGSFGPEVPINGSPALTMASVRMLDLDGDSGAEMVGRVGATWRAFRIVGNSWTVSDWPGTASINLQGVAVADLNGDNRMDVFAVSGSNIAVWMGTATGFQGSVTRPAINANEPNVTPATAQFPDLNGDGLADAMMVNPGHLLAYLGRGDGTFERVGQIVYPWVGNVDPAKVRLADLNRDGLLDLVRVDSSRVFWYSGRPDHTFAISPRILTRPSGADETTVVALADANGNGSTDIVWSSPDGMWIVDFAGSTHAGLLTAIQNGLGKTQQFGYTASTRLAWDAASSGSAWTTLMPVSIAVTTSARQTLASGEPDRTSLLSVRDGIYDSAERRFIGFQQSIQTFPGATAAETIQIFTLYHAGRGNDRVLRGQVLTTRTADGNGTVFKQVDNQVSALSVAGLPNDPRLKRAALTQSDITTSEPGETPAVVRTRYFYDDEGRQIEERRDGYVTAGIALDGDESIHRREYTVEDPITGVRDLVCEQTLLDGAEHVVSHSRTLFGDESSVAALCQSAKGWAREELSHLSEENRWVNLKQTAYDAHGNPALVTSGGVTRTLVYDAHGLYPISESVTSAPDRTLTWTAEWDQVAGTLLRATSPNGVSTRMEYDGLGRPISVAANSAPAHLHYRYNWSPPRPQTETFMFDGDADDLGALPGTWSPGSSWRHTVAVSNSAGEKLLSAVRVDVETWNVGEYRERDHRGRVTGLIGAFELHGGDPAMASPPADAARQTLSYDPLDRVVEQVLPTLSHKRVTYQPKSVTYAVDGLATVRTAVDGQGRTTRTERTVNGIVESVEGTYDAAGRILQFSLQGGQVRHDFVYDSLGRLIYAVDPDVGPRNMSYDDAGRITDIANGAGQTTTYSYDPAGRLSDVESTDVSIHYHYDVARHSEFTRTAGQLAWVEDAAGSVDFGYDDRGRQTVIQRTTDGTHQLAGRQTTQLSPSGLIRRMNLGDDVSLPFEYDPAGRLSQISGLWTAEQYDAAGSVLRERFGNGVTQRYQRDTLHRATQVTIENATGKLYDVAATYNPIGAIDTFTDFDGAGLDHTARFGYDSAGRLTSAIMGTGSNAYHFSYTYDSLQNLTRREVSGPTELGILAGAYQYSPSAPRRLTHIASPNGASVASFDYDAAGRRTRHNGRALTYNSLSQLTRVDLEQGSSVEHRYGYNGQRVATRGVTGDMTYWITPDVVARGSERDHYVRIGDRLIAKITTTETSLEGAFATGAIATRTTLIGLSLLLIGVTMLGRSRSPRRQWLRSLLATTLALLAISTGCGAPATQQANWHIEPREVYFHQTYSAGPQLTTDAAGQLQEDRRTEPFGAAIEAYRDGATLPIDYRLDSINALNKFTDPDTSWSDHGARWLAPDIGQWNSPDPPATAPDPKFMLDPWLLNPYQYANQNPVVYWDPDGNTPAAVMDGGKPAWAALKEAGKYVAGRLVAAGAALLAAPGVLLGLGATGVLALNFRYGNPSCGDDFACHELLTQDQDRFSTQALSEDTKNAQTLAAKTSASAQTQTQTQDSKAPVQWVVRGGKASADNLMEGSKEHKAHPGLWGFSVQAAPGKNIDELAKAGQFKNGTISVTTVDRLAAIGIAVVPSEGRGYHSTAVTGENLSPERAAEISAAFDPIPNPHRVR